MKLVCFPYAGGGASFYLPWVKSSDDNIEVMPVQLPGRESRYREPLFNDFRTLLDALVCEVAPHLGDSFAFFGHSFGALLAFELTHALHERGLRLPRHLFLSSYASPERTIDYPSPNELSQDEFLRRVAASFGGIPVEMFRDAQFRDLYLPILQADLGALSSYQHQPRPPLNCPFTVMGGEDDRQITFQDLRAWRFHAACQFKIRMYSGGHFYMRQHWAQMLEEIRSFES